MSDSTSEGGNSPYLPPGRDPQKIPSQQWGSHKTPTSLLAIASCVCGVVGLFLFLFHAALSLPAVLCGHRALSVLTAKPGSLTGKPLALVGLTCGYLGLLAQILELVMWFRLKDLL